MGNFDEAFRYYFDVIIKPFSRFMIRALDKIEPLDIAAVCPGHGPILRKNFRRYMAITREWSEEYVKQPVKNKIFIPYVSAYHKTGVIAEAISRGLQQAGDFDVDVMDVEHSSLGELEMKLTQSNAVIVGSPTINQNILLPIYRLFAVVNPYRDHGKLAGAFGSYGWSGENRKMLEENLRNLKFNFFGEGVFIKFSPGEEELKLAEEYGMAFAKQMLHS